MPFAAAPSAWQPRRSKIRNSPQEWDKSREKAHELRLELWGAPEEVMAKSVPIRQADNRQAAMDFLKEIAPNSPFTSRSGLSARLAKRSLGKIVSNAAVTASFCPEAHYLAAVKSQW